MRLPVRPLPALALCIFASLGIALWPARAAEPSAPAQKTPYRTPAESAALFQLPAGYRLELVVSEPVIREPVVTVFDGNGRMYVAEMRTYMQDIDGRNEKDPISRISLHWSSQPNGVFDRHSVFIDGLVLPRMILPLDGSLLVMETDSGDIFEYRDTDGDGVADRKTLFFHAEARKGNLEHQPSGLVWCADNWIYTTYNAKRIRWTPDGVKEEPTGPNGGQWGVSQDDYGKPWYVNAGGELGPLNFQQPIVYGAFKVRDELAPGFKEVWPLVPIPDVQGGPNRFRPEEKTLNHITAACGGEIYRGDRLPADLRGDLLFAEPVGRLIRRAKIEERDGVTRLRNAYEHSEFIRSTDPNFRPVNLANAPDGTLYITDMYRGIIQEGNWVRPGSYLRTVVQAYGLDQNFGRGRIWRLVHETTQPAPAPALLEAKPAALLAQLRSPNGWTRDTAQRLLILRQDRSVVAPLEEMARTDPEPLARFHALWTLEGLGALTPKLVRAVLRDKDVPLRVAALRAAETLIKNGDLSLRPDILRLAASTEPALAIQVMLTANLLKFPDATTLIKKTSQTSGSVGVKAIGLQLLNPPASGLGQHYGGAYRESLERGQGIFMELCFNCHGIDGKGTPIEGRDATLAPPLADSATVQAHPEAMIRALLHGVTGPIAGRTYDAQMVPLGANDDKWVSDVASFVRTSFGNRAAPVTVAEVARIRQATAARTTPWSLDDLRAAVPQPLPAKSLWVVRASHNPAAAPAAADANPKSVYDTGANQKPGMWLSVELPESTTVCGLRLESVKTTRFYPRGYTVHVSRDGTEWGQAVATGKGEGPVCEINFAATPAKFIRITTTANDGNNHWAVDEMEIYAPAPSRAPQR